MTRLKLWHNAAFCELLCHEKCLHSIANKYNSNIFCFYMERDLLYFFQRLCFSIINCTRILKRFWNSSWVLWWKLHFSNIPIDLSVVLDININAGNDQRRDRNPLKWKFTANISSREINYTMNTVTSGKRGESYHWKCIGCWSIQPLSKNIFPWPSINIGRPALVRRSRHVNLRSLVQVCL